MLGRKSSSPEAGPLYQLFEMKINWNKTYQSLDSTIFDSLHAEATLDCRLLDSFPDCISFHPCNHSSLRDCKTHLQSLDRLCLEASSSPSTLVVVTDASVIPSRCMQAVSAMHL